MTVVRSLPRGSVSMIISALIVASAILAGSYYIASGTQHDTKYYACLYAGSLSQVGTTEPANCGRGTQISWHAQGQPGVSGYVIADGDVRNVAAGQTDTDLVECPGDRVVLGGGPVFEAGTATAMLVRFSNPASDGSYWVVGITNTSADSMSWRVRATCAEMAVTPP